MSTAVSDDWNAIPLRVPAGWNVIHNALDARRLPDGRVEVNDSEDLYWARTAPRPWLTAEQLAEDREIGSLRAREINIDVGWYAGAGFRVVVLDPGWDDERASRTTPHLDELVATLEAWMGRITGYDEFPEP
ncbi:hypothetical protein [Streptomyces sp. HNM0574]|uniref:hypothetical protein n=1 Tax=Streptomyces sp. HNM0574 TaxID=2714954 RepID=UPI00146F4A3C|nr:hypothetical protein [Streptomyces sp. HNM0574]NLU68898.1 hypothetical protein [Streptomyces sp. HNM0574]